MLAADTSADPAHGVRSPNVQAKSPASPARPTGIKWRGSMRPATPLSDERGPDASATALRRAVSPHQVRHLLLQFKRPLLTLERQRLLDAGVMLQGYLGSNAYFARIDGDRLDAEQLATMDAFDAALIPGREHKMSRSIANRDFPVWSVVDEADGTPLVVAAHVLFHPDTAPPIARRVLLAEGATIHSMLSSINAVVVEATPDVLDALADRDEVQWIELPLPALGVSNAENRQATQADTVQTPADPSETPNPLYDLDGADVVVMLFDGGTAYTAHPDFDQRVTVRDTDAVSSHATHVAGTIGGTGLMSNGLHRGMAPSVTIESYGYQMLGDQIFLYDNPGDMENNYADAIRNLNAVLANNSLSSNVGMNGWPCEIMGDYGITSAIIDSIVRGELGAPISMVWAVGNEREFGVCGVAYRTVAPPAGAKNTLTVGAVNADNFAVTEFTGWGPVDDGRLRPDLVAPGHQAFGDGGVTSTSTNDGYSVRCGTSMATPTVTGIGALLIEDYRLQFPGRPDFAPAMLKTLLIHTAMDLRQDGPDYQTGYGMVQARDAIDLMREGNFTEATLEQGQTYQFQVNVESAGKPLKVTLAWDDEPGTPNVTDALVNDLDLTVQGPGGTYYPWTLDPTQPAETAVQSAADHLNNVEQVFIGDAQPGLYTVYVHGFNVPQGPQPFSLAASPELISTVIMLTDDVPAAVAPGASMPVTATIRATGETVVEGSARLHFRFGNGRFMELPMEQVGIDTYAVSIPTPGCGTSLGFYVSASGSMSGDVRLPIDAPLMTIQPPVGTFDELFGDDFEIDRGWTVSNGGGLFGGAWERGLPAGAGTRGDPSIDADGSGQCYLTGNAPGNSDVDGGRTTLTSPIMDASSGDAVISYRRWYSNMQGNNPNVEIFVVEVSDDAGKSWQQLESIGPGGPEVVGGWIEVDVDLQTIAGFEPNALFQIRFVADDPGSGSIVEAGIDGVSLRRFACKQEPEQCPSDTDDSGVVDIDDLIAVILAWGPCVPQCPDINGDGMVDVDDLVGVILAFGACPSE